MRLPAILPNILFCCFFALLLTSCKETRKESGKVFRLNLSSGLSSLDPAFSKDQPTMWVCNQLYNGLVQVDEGLHIRPSIAKSWTISDDGLLMSFHLRDDVFFHDHPDFPGGKGRRVVASDFVHSFARIIDEKVASTGAWLFNGKVAGDMPFLAPSDSVFQIRLQVPFRPMLSLLSLPYCAVVPWEITEKYGKDFRKQGVGTGPFRLLKWEENVALVLGKNPDYFESDSLGNKLPYIDGVKFSFVTDRAVEFLQLLQGNVDVVSGVDKSFRDKALTPDGQLRDELKEQLVYERIPYLNTEYLGFSMKKQSCKALADKRVRQALNYAIDREKMLTFLRNGIGRPAHSGMIPPGLPGFDSTLVKGYRYDPQKAEALLAAAGYPGGKGLDELTLHSNPQYQDLTDFIAKSLEEIGFKVRVQLSPGSFLREAMSKNEVDFFRASWIGDYPDAENYLALFYSRYSAPPNYTFFSNKEYDALYQRAISETDENQILRLYREMDQLILDEAPVIPLFYDEVVRFKGPRVQHLSINAMNMLVLKDAVLK
jgi:oligopeptide transport system substrate-binding protein